MQVNIAGLTLITTKRGVTLTTQDTAVNKGFLLDLIIFGLTALPTTHSPPTTVTNFAVPLGQ